MGLSESTAFSLLKWAKNGHLLDFWIPLKEFPECLVFKAGVIVTINTIKHVPPVDVEAPRTRLKHADIGIPWKSLPHPSVDSIDNIYTSSF